MFFLGKFLGVELTGVPHCFDNGNFVVSFEIGTFKTSNFVIVQDCFVFSGVILILSSM